MEAAEDLVDGELVARVALHEGADGAHHLQQALDGEHVLRVALRQLDDDVQHQVLAHQLVHEQRAQQVEEALSGVQVDRLRLVLLREVRHLLLVVLLAAVQQARAEQLGVLLRHAVHDELQNGDERVAVQVVRRRLADHRLDGALQHGRLLDEVLHVGVEHVRDELGVIQCELVHDVAEGAHAGVHAHVVGHLGLELREGRNHLLLLGDELLVLVHVLLQLVVANHAVRLLHHGHLRVGVAHLQQAVDVVADDAGSVLHGGHVHHADGVLLLFGELVLAEGVSARSESLHLLFLSVLHLCVCISLAITPSPTRLRIRISFRSWA